MPVHQIKTKLSNSWLIEQGAGLVVVDVARGCEDEVLDFIHALGHAPAEVRTVACTHDDPDHMGGVPALARACGAEVALPLAANSAPRKIFNDPTGFAFRFMSGMAESMRPRAWRMYSRRQPEPGADGPPPQNPVRLPGGVRRLRHGDDLPGAVGWQVVHTPGHSWDSCCFYHDASGGLISGDTLLASGKENRVVRPSILSNPLQLTRSLKLLQTLPVQTVYPGHGSVLSGPGLLDDL